MTTPASFADPDPLAEGRPSANPGPVASPEPFSHRDLRPAAASCPDPFADLDSLLELEDEIRSLSVQIHAATHRLLVLIAEFDRRRGWEVGGHRSCADWLSFRTGIDRGAARERVRAARALEDLPRTSEAMSRGELSFSQVRALTRVATTANEDELLEFARNNSASRLERLVRGWKSQSAESDTERDERLHRSRHLSVFPDEDGMYVVKGVLPAELGALLMRAIDASSDVLFREEGRRTPLELDPEGSRAAAARRRADALGLLAEGALAAGFTAEDGAPVSGTRPERYQVVLHVEEDTLRDSREAQGCNDGPRRTSGRPRVSAETGSGGTNCLLLCRHHHRLVHEGRWRIHWLGKAMPLFVDPRGQQHFDGGWKPPARGRAGGENHCASA